MLSSNVIPIFQGNQCQNLQMHELAVRFWEHPVMPHGADSEHTQSRNPRGDSCMTAGPNVAHGIQQSVQ